MDQTLGKVIKEFREAKKWTQEELANELGINRTLLAHIEKGNKVVSDNTAQKFVELINRIDIPKSFFKRNYEGRKLSNIVGVFVKSGLSQSHIRDEIFQVTGSQLSSMYVGLIPISKKIRDILINEYGVNWNYIEKGELPMFKSGFPKIGLTSPKVFTNPDVRVAIFNILEHNDSAWEPLENFFSEIKGYIKLWDDSMAPDLNPGDVLGVGGHEDTIKDGKIYYVVSEENLYLGRLFRGKANTVRIEYTNDKRENVSIKIDDIQYLIPVLKRIVSV